YFEADYVIRDQSVTVFQTCDLPMCLLMAYEHRPLEVRQDELATAATAHQTGVQPSIHPFTYDDFAPPCQEVQRIYPAVRSVGLDESRAFNGIFSFTPDGGPLLGQSDVIDGIWVAQAVWVTASVGV